MRSKKKCENVVTDVKKVNISLSVFFNHEFTKFFKRRKPIEKNHSYSPRKIGKHLTSEKKKKTY